MDMLRLQQQHVQQQQQQQQGHPQFQQQGRMPPSMIHTPDVASQHQMMSPQIQHTMNNNSFPGAAPNNGGKPENEFLVALQGGKSTQKHQQQILPMSQEINNNNNNNNNSINNRPPNMNTVSSGLHPSMPPPGLYPQGMQGNNANANVHNNGVESLDGLNGHVGGHQMPPPPQIPVELQPQSLIKHMVKDVIASNLYKEFNLVRQLAERYNVVSVNVEFAGTLARPIGRFRGRSDYIYQTVRTNVDLLDVLKIGISLSDEFGGKPDMAVSTWQFHFKMDPEVQMIPIETIELLQKTSTCIDTLPQNLTANGIEFKEFANLMMDSGLILNSNITWLTYGAGYDFAFLTQMLINTIMPNNKEDYIELCKQYFPNFYDLDLINKHLKAALILINKQKSGLNITPEDTKVPNQTIEMLADELQIPHYPHHNTAGGQSLLILSTFHILSKITNRRFPDGEDFGILRSKMYGINFENEPSI